MLWQGADPEDANHSDGLCIKEPHILDDDPDDVCADLENPEDPQEPDRDLEITDETLEDLEHLSGRDTEARISKWQPQHGPHFLAQSLNFHCASQRPIGVNEFRDRRFSVNPKDPGSRDATTEEFQTTKSPMLILPQFTWAHVVSPVDVTARGV
ncbi:hypothetical protein IscW_ISCW017123 [Ixodes scapularis]|uniref:Uncharacterized protein n=1 Tax=Ixodes scapularis TaxID=6945 RepID=B7PDE4_IXOSC|nr:hypothetical protein IscW_ISCW017123 [Ixodes scapularis]|eukprot:XP_002410759.1 hypothetical protein IscW_ISCW017123 [Ixodes scapularis]